MLAGCAGQTMRQEMADRKAAINASVDQCSAEMSSAAALEPIRNKIQVFRRPTDGPPPFEIACNDAFPTEAERPVISIWATMLEHCTQRSLAIATVPPSATPQQAVVPAGRRVLQRRTRARQRTDHCAVSAETDLRGIRAAPLLHC